MGRTALSDLSGDNCQNGTRHVRTYKAPELSGHHQQSGQDGFTFEAEGGERMKTWMAWALLIAGVSVIVVFCYWLTETLSVETCNEITIIINFIVSCYLAYEKYK